MLFWNKFTGEKKKPHKMNYIPILTEGISKCFHQFEQLERVVFKSTGLDEEMQPEMQYYQAD